MPKKLTRAKPNRSHFRTRVTGSETPATSAELPVPEVMTIEELADYLKLAVATLYKKAQAHEIPFTKVGNLLRFTKVSIDRWLARNTQSPDDNLYQQFARLQNRYHFQKWLEGRGVDWRELTDKQLAELAAKALEELRTTPPSSGN
jgi:excisionase family DNA binding protein